MSSMPPPPKPPQFGNRGKPATPKETKQDPIDPKMTENEVDFILRTSLTPEHREDINILKFISNYMRTRNKSQSAREAGLAPQAGHHLMNRSDIHDAVSRLTAKSLMKHGFDAEEIVARVKEIVDIDLIEFENEDGSFKTKMSDISPEARRAIKSFKAKNIYGTDPNGMKVVIGELIEVQLWDKMKGVELLGREKNLFKETKIVEHDVTSNMGAILLEAKRRGEESYKQLREANSEMPVIEVVQLEEGKGE